MYNTQNNALAEQERFMLPAAMPEGEFTQEELAEDMDGLQMSFPRIKIPAGGALTFEIPSDDPENPDYEKILEGVILFNHPNNAYWPEGSEYDDSATPLCSSVDGKQGIGEPGGSCAACALNQFGSAAEGNGKACKNMRVLYLLRSGEFVPIQISLPPTSLTPYNSFYNAAFARRQRPLYSSIVRIGLKRMSSNGYDYSVATFKRLYDFTGEDLARVRAYANSFQEQIELILAQRIENIEAETGNGVVMERPARVMPSNEGHFEVGAEINGDEDDLPL